MPLDRTNFGGGAAVPDEQRMLRYVSTQRLESLLDSSQLWFSNLASYGTMDPHEGVIPLSWYGHNFYRS